MLANNSSIPSFFKADILLTSVSPPHSSEITPYSANSVRIRSRLAFDLSIL